MISIAINTRVGGFGFSAKAIKRLAELDGKECFFFVYGQQCGYVHIDLEKVDDGRFYAYSDLSMDVDKMISVRDYNRDDPKLIQVIKELGNEASNRFSAVEIVEIPDGVDWYIDEDEDGTEVVREKSRSWS
jgi:hypothetical protein